jgi:hypothetical protein
MKPSICIAIVALWATVDTATAQQYVLQSNVFGSGAVTGTSSTYQLQGTVGQPAVGGGAAAGVLGNWGFWRTVASLTADGVFADLIVLLEGPYSSAGAMSAALPADSIPLSQPFSGSPWNYPGAESVAAGFFGSNPAIVDWVFVQARATTPAPTSPPMTVAASRAGFLKTDGSIVDIDGTSSLSFPSLSAGSYYVVVDHRNHIRAMSASGVATVNDTLDYDFTDSQAKAYTPGPPAVAMKSLSGSFFGLFAGDGTRDRQVTAADFNLWLLETKAVKVGYRDPDFDLDGQVTASDFNFWLANTKSAARSLVPNP